MALGPIRLADKSAWQQARYDDRARNRLHELRSAGQLGTCIVSTTELLCSARNADDFTRIRLELSSRAQLSMTGVAERHVVDTMAVLGQGGQHRMPIPGLMLAGIARAHSAVVPSQRCRL